MTYGLDTSVVIRLLMNEPPELASRTAEFVGGALRDGHDFFISNLVISEAYYVLQKYYYGKTKELAISDLKAITSAHGFSASQEAIAALDTPDAWKTNLGMIDRMIANEYAARGHVTLSCEKSFRKLDLVEIIS